MTCRGYLIGFLWLLSQVAIAQTRYVVIAIKKPVSFKGQVYFASDRNGWNPADGAYRFKDEHRAFTLWIAATNPSIEGKLTLGSWQTVEVSTDGADIPNRRLQLNANSDTIWLAPARFKDGAQASITKRSTASKRVKEYLVKSYKKGQFIKVWIWTPSDTTKRHPVLYMHDGLNLFDDSTAFASEWQVDETLESIEHEGFHSRGIIRFRGYHPLPVVVGIDNSNDRMAMLSPYKNEKHGGGEGDQYVRWIINTLKPFVDSVFSKQVDRSSTLIGGSSLGGLISAYAMIKYPDVFQRGFCFSSAIWFNPNVLDLPLAIKPILGRYPVNPVYRFYAYGGGQEGSQVDFYTKALADKFEAAQYNTKYNIRPDGTHQEIWWRKELIYALDHLLSIVPERRCCKCLRPWLQKRFTQVSSIKKKQPKRK